MRVDLQNQSSFLLFFKAPRGFPQVTILEHPRTLNKVLWNNLSYDPQVQIQYKLPGPALAYVSISLGGLSLTQSTSIRQQFCRSGVCTVLCRLFTAFLASTRHSSILAVVTTKK